MAHFQVVVAETDLSISVRKARYNETLVAFAEEAVRAIRQPLEAYIQRDPGFVRALAPYGLLPDAPEIARTMAEAANAAHVGPMAAVAGAIAEEVGKRLAKRSRDVVVENGGDIYLRTSCIRRVGIFAGESPLSDRVALEIRPEDGPLGICTSSGKVGHSLSFGQADAVVAIAPSAALADAVATACGNLVQTEEDIENALDFALGIPGMLGAVVVVGDRLGMRGKVRIAPLRGPQP